MLKVREISVHKRFLYDSLIASKELPQLDMSHRICGKRRERVDEQDDRGREENSSGHKKCNQPVPKVRASNSNHAVLDTRHVKTCRIL